MKRRMLMKAIPLGLAGATFSLRFPSLMAAIAGEKEAAWSYNDPKNWGNLSQEYQVCTLGNQQSPIDLISPIPAQLDPIEIVYHDIPLNVIKNHYTLQVNNRLENYIILDEKRFDLIQFHFHHPSEHTVTGKTYPMEIHFVHKNNQNELVVVGIFLQEGKENEMLQPIWEIMSSQLTKETLIPGVNLPIQQLLPNNSPAYRYFGSLTTPPCSEVVQWIIFDDPIEISLEQIKQFQQTFPVNARPIQPLNRRFILSVSK